MRIWFFIFFSSTAKYISWFCRLLFIGVPEWKQGKNVSHVVTHLLKGGLYFVDFLFQRWCSLLWKGLSGSFWSQVWSMSPVHYWESPRGTCFVRWSLRIGPHPIMFWWSCKKKKKFSWENFTADFRAKVLIFRNIFKCFTFGVIRESMW